MKSILPFLCFFLLLLACGDDSDQYECVAFDERQCAGDPWATQGADIEETINALEEYLEDISVDVEEITYDPNFYDAVCEACIICPTGLRFFIKVQLEDIEKLQSEDLLNLEITSCNDVF